MWLKGETLGKTTLATVAFSMIVGIAHADFNPGTCTYDGILWLAKTRSWVISSTDEFWRATSFI